MRPHFITIAIEVTRSRSVGHIWYEAKSYPGGPEGVRRAADERKLAIVKERKGREEGRRTSVEEEQSYSCPWTNLNFPPLNPLSRLIVREA